MIIFFCSRLVNDIILSVYFHFHIELLSISPSNSISFYYLGTNYIDNMVRQTIVCYNS